MFVKTINTILFALFLFISNGYAQSPKETIAVYHFTADRGYSYDYALGAGNAIEAGILRSNRFVVVERTRFGVIREEDKFRKANTSDIVDRAAKLGAKTVVTGHVVGVSRGDIISGGGKYNGKQYIEISLSFKIIDVTTSQIMKSEIIRGRGEGKNTAEAMQSAYLAIDRLGRAYIGDYLPQQFKYMSTLETERKKDTELLKRFKIWGGSDDGLQTDDVVNVYHVTYLTNPNTGKQVEEKKLIGQAKIDEVNSGSTSTCTLLFYKKYGAAVMDAITHSPNDVRLEYKGNWHEKKTIWDLIGD
jgi:hypothetical protein